MFTHVNIGEIQSNGAAIMGTLSVGEQHRQFIADEAGLQVVSTAMNNHDESTMEKSTYHELLNEGISLLYTILSDPRMASEFTSTTDRVVCTKIYFFIN